MATQEFKIKVVVDPSGARRGASVTNRELGRVEKKALGVGKALRSAFLILGGGILLTSSIRTLASFGQEMSTVGAITRATASEFSALSDEAKRLGTETRFSATEAAEGMTSLARAGFDASQTLEATGATLNLAQAGALGLGDAADIATNVLTGFGLQVSEIGRVVDVLALGANSANTDVRGFGEAMKFIAPVAAGLGVPLEEAAVAVEQLANAGLKGGLGGRGLRGLLAELQSPSDKLAGFFEDAGVAADEFSISNLGLAGSVQALADAGVDATNVFGLLENSAATAFLALRQQAGATDEMRAALDAAEGSAERIAKAMDDNLNGAILATRSAFQGLILELGDQGATGALRGFFEFLTGGLRFAIANIDPLILGIQGISAALLVGLAGQAIPAVIGALGALKVALLTNPITLLPGIIAIAIGALVAFRHEIADVHIAGARLGDVISASFDAIVERALFIFPVVRTVAVAIFDDISNFVKDTFDNMVRFVLGFGDEVTVGFGSIFGAESPAHLAVRVFGNLVIATFLSIGDFIANVALSLAEKFNAVADFDFDNPIQSALRLAKAFDPVNNAIDVLGATADDFKENFSTDFVGGFEKDLEGFADRIAPMLLNGFKGLSGGDAARAFFDIGGQINEEIARKKAERVAGAFAQAFEAEVKIAASVASAFVGGFLPPEFFAPFESATKTVIPEVSLPKVPQLDLGLGADIGGGVVEPERVELTNQALEDQARVLGVLRGEREDLIASQTAVQTLFDEGTLSAEEYSRAMLEIGGAMARISGTVTGGFAAGLASSKQILQDFSSVAERTVVNAFGAAEDALVNFAKTGKISFSGFVDGIISDLARLLARQALLGLLNVFTGGLGGTLAGAFGGVAGARAGGGPVTGGDSFLVGEEGPEIFTPKAAGNITPAGETAAMLNGGGGSGQTVVNVPPSQPQVNTFIVEDESRITAAMESPSGEQAILNVVRRNKDTIGAL